MIVPLLVPLVSIIVSILLAIDIAKTFRRSAGFGAGLGLLGFIFAPILGFGGSRYVGYEDLPISFRDSAANW